VDGSVGLSLTALSLPRSLSARARLRAVGVIRHAVRADRSAGDGSV